MASSLVHGICAISPSVAQTLLMGPQLAGEDVGPFLRPLASPTPDGQGLVGMNSPEAPRKISKAEPNRTVEPISKSNIPLKHHQLKVRGHMYQKGSKISPPNQENPTIY